MAWLNAHIAYWHWMILGLALVASEFIVPRFIMLWFGASAVAVGLIMAVVDLSLPMQVLIWGLLSGIDLLVWFKLVHPRMKRQGNAAQLRELAQGRRGRVISKGEKFGHGMLELAEPLGGERQWPFVCPDPIEVGDVLRVEDLNGQRLVVRHDGP